MTDLDKYIAHLEECYEILRKRRRVVCGEKDELARKYSKWHNATIKRKMEQAKLKLDSAKEFRAKLKEGGCGGYLTGVFELKCNKCGKEY